ncbi:LytTR family DNA-binding domain-containing protein [Marivirga harenae]|uniref:LytR/AlgR family response regulator transcription factor n=1 Tax=Marivirga harenae TaxID=2010992 RepID=UPI0026E0EB2C|nr:LytTR family DNA-binding domain-containing protein [Marivirga harenae]WKV13746.1 LytTR family DNA-binding domain-containing protein [Marivirga harenae]|tara:strand:+ start:34615 stop:35331 length:717 start_codon:yes stop_codon:yes gene_type:complete
MERKLTAILVDDELHCLETLRFDLDRFCSDQISIVGEAQNLVKASTMLISEKPDILFLDIDLPEMNGLEFLETIGDIGAKVVFTTAHSKYAIPAYKFKAEAFLLKPIEASELQAVVSKIYYDKIKEEKHFTSERLAINDMHGTTYIPYDHIIACESNNNYCKVHLKDGTSITVSKTLKHIEQAIKSNAFLRIHQSYLINANFISKYLKSDGGSLEMMNKKIYPISKSYKEKVTLFLKV